MLNMRCIINIHFSKKRNFIVDGKMNFKRCNQIITKLPGILVESQALFIFYDQEVSYIFITNYTCI